MPAEGKAQIGLVIFVIEVATELQKPHYMKGGKLGYIELVSKGMSGVDLLVNSMTEEQKKKRRTIELQNGRLDDRHRSSARPPPSPFGALIPAAWCNSARRPSAAARSPSRTRPTTQRACRRGEARARRPLASAGRAGFCGGGACRPRRNLRPWRRAHEMRARACLASPNRCCAARGSFRHGVVYRPALLAADTRSPSCVCFEPGRARAFVCVCVCVRGVSGGVVCVRATCRGGWAARARARARPPRSRAL